MWIEAHPAVCGVLALHSRSIQTLRVMPAKDAREHHGPGCYTEYRSAPKTGFAVVAWRGSGPVFLAPGLSESTALALYAALLDALEAGTRRFNVEAVITQLEGTP